MRLGDLSVLTGQQSQVTGLQGFIQQYLPKTGLEQFQESGQLSQGAIDEYVAAGALPRNCGSSERPLRRSTLTLRSLRKIAIPR